MLLRRLYTFFYWLLLPFIILRLIWRSCKAPAYRQRMAERFSFFKPPKRPTDLWVHAVSLGEVIAATPLIKAFQTAYPNASIVVTTMTPTGAERVNATFGDSVLHHYVPYDLPLIVKRFIRKVKPHVLVIIETELWPNLLACCTELNVPVLLANARLSERSAVRYQKIAPVMREMMQSISTIAVQTQVEAERFIKAGAKSERVIVTGSIKFDISLPADLEARAGELRAMLGRDRPIWIAASTHEGEEEYVLQAFVEARKRIPNLLLILVPRHPERFSKVEALCQKYEHKVVLRSSNQPCTSSTTIFIGDTMGELLLMYATADVAFVGGSLVSIGGHNLLEPAALQKATITGPHMHNFLAITALLLEAKGVKQIQQPTELGQNVVELFMNPAEREAMGTAARKVVEANRGALEKQLNLIKAFFVESN